MSKAHLKSGALCALLLAAVACERLPTTLVLPAAARPAPDLRLAFGSCADDEQPDHPVWSALAASAPDALILMGDNVYADSAEFNRAPSAQILRAEYAKLAAAPGFARLREQIPVFATWDDHDYGLNDGGAEFAHKAMSAEVFLEFWDLPIDHPVHRRPGIYHERRLRHAGLDVQLLLLDTRSFRTELLMAPRTAGCPLQNFAPNPHGAVLGEAQWHWLEAALAQPADLRVLVSSIQVIPTEHCWEKWANFPAERTRLLDLIARAGVANLVIVSGDRHLGEISALAGVADTVPTLYELTASPLSARSGFGQGERNSFRVSADNLTESQFGVLDVRGSAVYLGLVDVHGQLRFEVRLPLTLEASL